MYATQVGILSEDILEALEGEDMPMRRKGRREIGWKEDKKESERESALKW